MASTSLGMASTKWHHYRMLSSRFLARKCIANFGQLFIFHLQDFPFTGYFAHFYEIPEKMAFFSGKSCGPLRDMFSLCIDFLKRFRALICGLKYLLNNLFGMVVYTILINRHTLQHTEHVRDFLPATK